MSGARVAVLISGRGSNLQSLIEAAQAPDFPAEISLVISNRPKAAGLDHATKAGITQQVIDHKDFQDAAGFEEALNDELERAEVDYVCLAGFMRILSADFVDKWRERLLNIHPSLLPAFKGLSVQERMIDAGIKIAGCTVHFVSPEMDAGPIIGQAAVPVLPGDTAETLGERILQQEHSLYPACLKIVVEGKARLSGGAVRYDSDVAASGRLINPPQ